jgi:hypothetical protein
VIVLLVPMRQQKSSQAMLPRELIWENAFLCLQIADKGMKKWITPLVQAIPWTCMKTWSPIGSLNGAKLRTFLP